MKILFASAEVDPFAKVGGLADVAAALPQRLLEMGHDVRVVTPCHPTAAAAHTASTAHRLFTVPMQGPDREIDVATTAGIGGVPVDLIAEPGYFGRTDVYGEPDDLYRYQFFCRAIVEMLKHDEWIPDILHLNDWHTAPLAFAMRNLAWAHPRLRGVGTVFTIHNLRYRGPDEFNDFLAQAIYYSDVITTVSPTYAREILTRDYGEGLESLRESLRKRPTSPRRSTSCAACRVRNDLNSACNTCRCSSCFSIRACRSLAWRCCESSASRSFTARIF